MKSLPTKSVRTILQQRLRHSYLECTELAATSTRKNLKTRAQAIRELRSAGVRRDASPVVVHERYTRRPTTLADNEVIGYPRRRRGRTSRRGVAHRRRSAGRP